MKYLLVLNFLFLLGCGAEPVPEDMTSTIGEVRSVKTDDKMTAGEKNNFLTICNSLEVQQSFLEQYVVNQDATVKLTARVANCGQTEPTVSYLDEKVELENGNLVMPGAPFKNILTKSSPLIKDFCTKVATDIDQDIPRGFQVAGRGRWFAVYGGKDKKCNGPSGSDNELCIYMETGVKNGNNENSFIIQDVEVFKIGIQSNISSYGHVVDHSLATTASCSKDGEKYFKGQTFTQFNL